ncbi:hypothetical protein ACFS07_02210 [Undibacterium arcticum]
MPDRHAALQTPLKIPEQQLLKFQHAMRQRFHIAKKIGNSFSLPIEKNRHRSVKKTAFNRGFLPE